MSVALVCIALLGVLIFGLGFMVSQRRAATKRVIGYDPDPTDALHKWVRAHGNAAEYAPMLALLFYLVARGDSPTWALWVIAIITLCRYLHALGMLLGKDLSQPHPLRFVGALGTYVGGLALSLQLALGAIG